MTRFVIGPDVALRLAADRTVIPEEHRLVAPALLRSQVLALLYAAVGKDETTKAEAVLQLDHLRGLRIRLLGDRVLQSVAWKLADRLHMADTFTAEYLAVTQLQADAFITLDNELAKVARAVVTVAPLDALFEPDPHTG